MCWIGSQSKILIHLKYLIFETPYTFFSIFSWHRSFMYNEHYHVFFQALTTTTFSCVGLKDIEKMM